MHIHRKTVAERVVHAIGYEIIAILLFVPVGALLLDRGMLHVGGVALLLSVIAMALNMIYNGAFDHFWPVGRFSRGLKLRVLHAVGFEAAYIAISIPVTAYALDISFMTAFLTDLGFMVFVLPYTLAYNWAFDALRAWLFRPRLSLGRS